MLSVLLRQRLRLFWNRLTRGSQGGRRMVGTVLAATLMTAFVLYAGLNAGLLAERIARTDPQAATQSLPVLLIGVTVLTLVTSLSSAFHHLFLAGDMELLLAAGVPGRSLLWLKVLEVWRDSLHIVLFQAAALVGYGQSLRLAWTFYPLAMLCGVLLTLAASALGTVLTLGLARVRFGQSILGLSRLVAVILFLPVGALGVPTLGFGRGRTSLLVGPDTIQSTATDLRALGPPAAWLPTTWVSHVLLGDDAAVLSASLIVVATVVVFIVSQLMYDLLFQAAWERVRFGTQALAVAGSGVRFTWRPSGPVSGVLQKDWRMLVRDPRWRTGALVSAVALGLPAMVLFAADPVARASHTVQFWFGMLPVPYLAYLFGSQQGAATLAYEGRNIALLRAAPIGMGRLIAAKVLGGLILVLSVTWVATMALAVSHGGNPVEIGAALLAATWLAVGASVAAIAGAALTADFDSDNPQRRVGCLGTLITSSLSVFFFGTNTALLVWWVARTALSVPRPLLVWLPVVDWGLPMAALLSVAALAMAARLGMRRLSGWEIS